MKEIIECGHEIGLHFDEKKYFDRQWSEREIVDKILGEKRILEEIIAAPVSTVSMHRPSKATLGANLTIPGMINTYSSKFFKEIKYVSDSYHRWREDVYKVIEKDRPDKIQVLTHAFWYDDISRTRAETFRNYVDGAENSAYKMLEDNVLPLGVTMEDSLNEVEG